MPIEQYTNLAFWFRTVFITYLWIFFEKLCLVIYPFRNLGRCTGIVLGNIVVDVLQPCFCLNCLSYLCHERTRFFIFSLDITWHSRESIRPRSTIRSDASSRRISSYVASSGCDSMTSFIFSFTIAMDSLLDLRHKEQLSRGQAAKRVGRRLERRVRPRPPRGPSGSGTRWSAEFWLDQMECDGLVPTLGVFEPTRQATVRTPTATDRPVLGPPSPMGSVEHDRSRLV